jgi:uncharacterized protein DUF5995
MLDDVQDRLILLSPSMTLLDLVGGRTDEAVMNFSIQRAREAAWRVAERLAPLDPEKMHKEIDVLDRWVDVLASLIRYPPGNSIRLTNFLVRLTESRDVERVIDVLAESSASEGAIDGKVRGS